MPTAIIVYCALDHSINEAAFEIRWDHDSRSSGARASSSLSLSVSSVVEAGGASRRIPGHISRGISPHHPTSKFLEHDTPSDSLRMRSSHLTVETEREDAGDTTVSSDLTVMEVKLDRPLSSELP